MTIYRSAVAGLEGIASVGRAATVDGAATFAALADARPQSLAGQQAARELRALPSPSPAQVGGQPADLLDAAARIGEDLPRVGLLILALTALLWGLLFRSLYGAALALTSALAPLAGLAAMVVVFGDGRFSDLLDYAPSGAPHLQAYVIVAAVLLALGLSRGAQFATALREERTLGGGAAGSLARSGTLTLLPVAVTTLVGVVLAGVWLGADLLARQGDRARAQRRAARRPAARPRSARPGAGQADAVSEAAPARRAPPSAARPRPSPSCSGSPPTSSSARSSPGPSCRSPRASASPTGSSMAARSRPSLKASPRAPRTTSSARPISPSGRATRPRSCGRSRPA